MNNGKHWWNCETGARLECGGIVVRDKGAWRLIYHRRDLAAGRYDYVALERRAADSEKGAVYVQSRDLIYQCEMEPLAFWCDVARRWNDAHDEKPPVTGLQLQALAYGAARAQMN